ncbi:MAG: 4-hydroxy-tetrahydrodipicolinate synthase [Bacillus thermozeamaize]|jgi:4-hydroxy-tetrahydrodipicolinate synthase|uniref:4-hydroxy-tetrahydrodipicolinate synthase n=1 Tax=Bacillus thermozeamaize TaxID=230954 RepID=A0A1Y3PTD9_9BACI|nr:MAG: 4-hydroxy-tetrahydrodipicolinate synthase [Bacillus thermozeamaize]
MKFGRVITAMITPFDERGQVDWEACGALIDHLVNHGTDDLVVAGTTGESPTLTDEEKLELFRFAVQKMRGRGQVIAGVGGNNTEKTIWLSREAQKCGVHALMLVLPYYNRPSQEGLYQHFKAIAGKVDLPIMLYNIPGRTAVNLTPETLKRLAEIDNIVAIKEASGDLTQMTRMIAVTHGDIALYSGDDKLTLPVLSIGGKGVVSVASHVVGRQMQQMIDHFAAGRVSEAARLHQHLLELFEVLFITNSPAPLKFLLNHLGIKAGPVRLPLAEVSQSEAETILRVYQATVNNEA